MTLDKTSATVSLGRTQQLKATVAPANASFAEVTWSSSDTSVATVDANGLVTTLSTGTTTIAAASVDNPSIKGTAVINVVPVMVTGLMLDKSTLNLMIGTTKPITAAVMPADAYNKKIVWSSSDESIATVDASGRVTGHLAGTAVVTAVTDDGGFTKTLTVNVQSTPVAVTGIATDKAAFYFASDAFSTTNPSAVLPSVQLKAAIAPEDATNLDVEWKSNNPSIATVDAFGVVTARKPGVAFITATSKDGGFEARTAVYVPSISESFDNRALADNWSVSAGSAAAIPAAVATPPGYAGQLLQFSAGGSGARAAYKSLNIANNKIVLDFDWNVGSPAAGTGQLRIQDGAHNNYLTLGVPTGASSTLQYSTSATLAANTPLSGSAVAASGFNTASTMYNVRITLDMTAKKTSFTLTNKSTAQTTTVADLPFAPGTSFDGKLGYLELYATRNAGGSMNWNTQFDNFNVYAAAPTASSVSLNRPTVSLLDIPGTPGNTFQLKATVNPNVEGVDQAVTWSTSDEAIATVSQSGLVTAVSDGIATVTATVVSNPSLSATAGVSVHPIIPVEAIGIQDDHGTAIDETTVNVKTGDAKQLKAVLNPSVADVRSLTWSSSDPAVASIDHDTGLLTALAAGDTVVTLTVDAYPDFGGYTGSTSFNLHVTGPAVLIVTGLQSAIADAIAAKTLPDNGYTADSLSRYKTALEAAQTALTQAQTELWDASHQPEIDGLAADLQAAAAALALDQSAPVEAVTVSPGALTLTVGLSGQLVAEVLPVYAGDKRLAWSSDNETIAVVDASGRVTALAPGTAHIEAKALNGGVVGTTTVTVASDLSSGYAANGGAVSASKSKSGYTPSNPIANASTMNPAGAAWTTGGNLQTTTTPEFWQIDLGSTARIDNVKMNFWQTMKYSLLVSDDSVNWTTAYDNSQSYGGDTAAIFDVQLPAATYGRYIRLNIYGVSTTKDWVGVTVFQANGAFVPAPESVTANKSQASLEIGATLQLNAQVTPAYGDPRLTWSSSDDAVATVDATGHVTAIGAGSAVIEATTVNGKKAEVALTVVTEIVPVTGVNVDQEPFSLIAGTAGQVTATIMPAEATNKTVVWTSSDTSVATVGADGKVTAKAPGTATITATTEDGGFTATTTVTVTKSTDPEPVDTKVTGVSVDKASLDLIVGATGQLIATVAPADATNKTVVWTSSDTSVATVGADGKVTAKAPGTATITATTEDGGFKAAATVTVTAPAGGVNPDPVVTSPPASDNGTPATNVDADGRVKIAAKPDATGNVKASLTAASLAQAIAKATSGKLQIQVDAPQASGKIEVELPVGELLKTDGTIKSLSIRSGDVDMTLAIDASVLGADAKTLNVSMVPAQRGELSEQARQLVGDRPVYDLDLRVDGEKVSSFGSKGAVVVSIDYTLKAGEDVSGLVIFFIGEDGKMEPVKRSGYDEANGRITFRPAHFSRYAVAYVPVALKDLNEAPWAKSMIQSLAARQILRGTSTDSFEPGRSVTRAEFLQMLVSSLGLDKTDLTGASAFSDVPAGVWYEKAVASGVQLGIVKGRADGTFGAHEAVTREDMAVMLSRALQAAGLGLGDEAESGADFNDRSEIAAYATAAVDDIRRAGLINGFQDGSFGPKLPTTRAQAAAVIYKLLGF
ncbi:Ig-like domain-containing protein [Cohnella ginsengisoli]|uniref:Ig-like domain-containing protein n=1 Tax=Cohnella ginsengisoli TaxID=425004 RepID=A0A9X4KGH3_9BACL|nr:Ig-like domain-containing protein [Cohnella ginsengisoli]MDG0791516.1 Ig-like domain-containing protein [Cohnella ginsengisoli]